MRWIAGKGLLLFVVAAGCAGVNVYTDKELKNKTGLPFYMAKPYLLVKRTGATASVSVDVIYLPDLEHPLYAAQRVGVGKAKMTVKMADGKLTEFTADADSRAAEFTGALTTGLKSIAAAVKIQREAEILRAEARALQERHAAAAELEQLADRISRVGKRGSEDVDRMAPEFAETLSGALRTEARNLKDPRLRGNEVEVANRLQDELGKMKREAVPAGLMRDLDRVIVRIRGAAMTVATFELYEFRMKDGQTTLVRVAGPE